MKLFSYLLIVSLLTVFACETQKQKPNKQIEVTPSREFYQLKTYSFATKEQENRTDNYLKNSLIPALHRQDINNIGVFKPRQQETDTTKRILVLIPFESLEQFIGMDNALLKDSTYLNTGNDYINASHENPPYVRIQSILMRAFENMPKLFSPQSEVPKADRIYELRSYESPTEEYYKRKVAMFNEGGEIKLFDRLGFNAVFYAEVISGDNMPNLMYMTTFSDQETRDKLWKAFFDSPEWKELLTFPKYENTVSHADIYFLYPVDYSDY
jgi:hypothetical protein